MAVIEILTAPVPLWTPMAIAVVSGALIHWALRAVSKWQDIAVQLQEQIAIERMSRVDPN